MYHMELIAAELYCRSRKLTGFRSDPVASLHGLISWILARKTSIPLVGKQVICGFKTSALGSLFEEQNSQVLVCCCLRIHTECDRAWHPWGWGPCCLHDTLPLCFRRVGARKNVLAEWVSCILWNWEVASEDILDIGARSRIVKRLLYVGRMTMKFFW